MLGGLLLWGPAASGALSGPQGVAKIFATCGERAPGDKPRIMHKRSPAIDRSDVVLLPGDARAFDA